MRIASSSSVNEPLWRNAGGRETFRSGELRNLYRSELFTSDLLQMFGRAIAEFELTMVFANAPPSTAMPGEMTRPNQLEKEGA